MSYDLTVWVKVADCEGKYARIATPEYDHPTYNLGKLFRVATGWDFVQGMHYRADKIMTYINSGIHELKKDPGAYEKYLPDNGWGSIESAIKALRSLRECIYEQAEEIPMKCLWVSW